MKAAGNGDYDVVQYWLDKEMDPDVSCEYYYGQEYPIFESMTAVFAAARKGHLDIVKQLVRAGCRLDLEVIELNSSCQFFNRNIPLHAAAYNGDLPMVEYLWDNCYKNSSNSADSSPDSNKLPSSPELRFSRFRGKTRALYFAAAHDHLAVVMFLYGKGCVLDYKDEIKLGLDKEFTGRNESIRFLSCTARVIKNRQTILEDRKNQEWREKQETLERRALERKTEKAGGILNYSSDEESKTGDPESPLNEYDLHINEDDGKNEDSEVDGNRADIKEY